MPKGLWFAAWMFVGTRVGLAMPRTPGADFVVDACLVLGLIAAMSTWILRGNRWSRMFLLPVAIVGLGAALAGNHVLRSDPHGLRIGPDAEPVMVRTRCVLRSRPMPREPPARDLLDPFIVPRTDPPWVAMVTILQIHDGEAWVTSSGVIRLQIQSVPGDLLPGTVVVATGWLERDAGDRSLVRVRGRTQACEAPVATLRCDEPPRVDGDPGLFDEMLNRARHWLDGNLLECLGHQAPERHRSLVVAMTTGRLLPGIETVQESFREAGLSHFLAISGFNVAVLFMMARWLMEWLGIPWRTRGWITILLGMLFLLMVEPGVSVLRAGLSGSVLGLAGVLRRGWSATGVLGVVAIITLIADPCEAASPGFQLSFGAVLGLVHGTPHVEHVLGARHAERSRGILMRSLHAMRVALSASIAAWLVSVPITLHQGGLMHPWCAITSTVLGPCAALMTVVASVGAILGNAPGADTFPGALLRFLAWFMEHAVRLSIDLPARIWNLGMIPWWWAAIALVCLTLWWRSRPGRVPGIGWLVTSGLIWLLGAATLPDTITPAHMRDTTGLSWITLDLGDSRAHLISSGGFHTLIDGGSSTHRAIGSRQLVPALRALGVQTLDRIVVRRASLDRFSGLPELLDALPVGQVVLASSWSRMWSPGSAQSMFLERAREKGIPLRILDRELGWEQGFLTWRCLSGSVRGLASDISPLIVVRHAQLSDHACVVLAAGCSGSLIERALVTGSCRRPLALEWPPAGLSLETSRALLQEMDPEHVIMTSRQDPTSMFERWTGSEPRWGSLPRDGSMRFTADASPTVSRLLRWRSGAWQSVTR
jgi:ComEC/Rec2-related protein